MQKHDRRVFLKQILLSASSLVSTSALAQVGGFNVLNGVIPAQSPVKKEDSQAGVTPFDLIAPVIESEKKTVRFFFSYECEHCRKYHNGLVQWGSTLPKGVNFQTTPLITGDSDVQLVSIYARLIGQVLNPESVNSYDALIYQAIHGDADMGVRPRALDANAVLAILVQAGVPSAKIKAFMASSEIKSVEKKLPVHAEAAAKFNIKSTPSVSLFGKYTVNPDHANGNPQQFLTLLNGLISRHLNA